MNRLQQLVAVVGLGLTGTGCLAAGDFQLYWNASDDMNPAHNPTKTKWTQHMKLDPSVWNKNIYILYEWQLGIVDKDGPHHMLSQKRFKRHLAKVAQDVQKLIPDPNFDGVAIIDYEMWAPVKFKYVTPKIADAWTKTYVERNPWVKGHPEYDDLVGKKYEETARAYFLETLQVCKKVRPHAKWGFYAWPLNFHNGEYTKPDPNPYKMGNDELKWLYDAVDVIAPNLYQDKFRVPASQLTWDKETEWSPEEHRIYVESTIKEAQRISQGKPILCYMWAWHWEKSGPHNLKLMHKEEIEECAKHIKELGVDGIILWEDLSDQTEVSKLQNWLDTLFLPILDEYGLIKLPASGSGGGGNSPGWHGGGGR